MNLQDLSSGRAAEIAQGLSKAITPVFVATTTRAVESTVHLRRLFAVHGPAYQAALHVVEEDFLELCRTLDRSGISAAVADFAKDELQDFSFEANGDAIAKELGLDRFIAEWKVPAEKYRHFWPYVDKSVRTVFTGAEFAGPFEIEPIARRVFRICEQPDAFEEWELLKWNWKVFCSVCALTLGGASAATGVGLAGVAAGAAGLAAQ